MKDGYYSRLFFVLETFFKLYAISRNTTEQIKNNVMLEKKYQIY